MAAAILGLWMLATPLVSGLLLVSLERGLPLAPGGAPPAAIVILSADADRSADRPELAPGSLTLERERAGAALARQTGLPILVTGGLVGEGRQTLAGVMQASLAGDFGTPVQWVETQAQDTWENAANSAAILKAHGIGSVYVVTHAWHMRRALIAFSRTGISVTAAPVRLDPAPTGELTNLLPHASSWLTSYYALHEWIGCIDYALFR